MNNQISPETSRLLMAVHIGDTTGSHTRPMHKPFPIVRTLVLACAILLALGAMATMAFPL